MEVAQIRRTNVWKYCLKSEARGGGVAKTGVSCASGGGVYRLPVLRLARGVTLPRPQACFMANPWHARSHPDEEKGALLFFSVSCLPRSVFPWMRNGGVHECLVISRLDEAVWSENISDCDEGKEKVVNGKDMG